MSIWDSVNPNTFSNADNLPALPLRCRLRSFRYLGVQIFHDDRDIVVGNLGRMLIAMRESVRFWIKLPLSEMGRLALSKMVILPHFLNFFANVPVMLPSRIFRELNKILLDLI